MNGLFALLDDVAAIAKMAAVSMDDIASQSAKSVAKATGIVIDDTATTPQFVTGLTPDREVPIIMEIAKGSIRNKAVISAALFGVGLGVSAIGIPVLTVATPFLMAGGVYLAYEGYEKLFRHDHHEDKSGTPKIVTEQDQKREEKKRIADAIRTDIILSGEILALTFAGQATATPLTQIAVLGVTSILMTAGVYGAVAMLVKADDLGLVMARSKVLAPINNAAGRGLVKSMPYVFKGLGFVGAVAMLWVGGGMVLHGAAHFGLNGPAELVESAAHTMGEVTGGLGAWLTEAGIAGILGTAMGAAAIKIKTGVEKLLPKKHAAIESPADTETDMVIGTHTIPRPVKLDPPVDLEKIFAAKMIAGGTTLPVDDITAVTKAKGPGVKP